MFCLVSWSKLNLALSELNQKLSHFWPRLIYGCVCILFLQELISDDQSLFEPSFNDPFSKPSKQALKGESQFYNKKRPIVEAQLEEPLAKRPYVPNNDFVERNSPSPVPQNLSHEKRVIVPAGKSI